MEEKTNREKDDKLTELNVRFPAIKVSQEILDNMNRVYLSPQLTSLSRTVQEIGKSMFKVANSPAMEQLANLNQVFADSTSKFYDSPAMENLMRINQEISESMAIISSSPAMEKMAILNRQLAVSVNNIYSSLDYQKQLISIQKTVLSLNKIPTNIHLKDLVDSSYLASVANELHKYDTFTNVMESPEEKTSAEEVGSFLQQGITVSDYQALEKKLDTLLERSKEPDRITKKDIILLVLNILFSPIFQPFHDVYSEWVQMPANYIIKTIKNDIKSSYEQDIYSRVRIVKKDELKIKQNNRRDSSTIGELNVGDVVEIIYKKKNWTKIRKIENDVIVEGWVYTRYLQKIN